MAQATIAGKVLAPTYRAASSNFFCRCGLCCSHRIVGLKPLTVFPCLVEFVYISRNSVTRRFHKPTIGGGNIARDASKPHGRCSTHSLSGPRFSKLALIAWLDICEVPCEISEETSILACATDETKTQN